MTVKELIEELEYVYNKDLRVGFELDGVMYGIYQVDIVTLNDGDEVCQIG